jgi:hypothetical protein
MKNMKKLKILKYIKLFNESFDFDVEKDIIESICFDITDENFYIEIREEETDDPNKKFILVRIHYKLNPDDPIYHTQGLYNIPMLSNYTYKWSSVKYTVDRLIGIMLELPHISLYMLTYIKILEDKDIQYKKEFIYSKADGDIEIPKVNYLDINDDIQVVDIVFLKKI